MSQADSAPHTPTVLVTGAAKRLGRATATALAQAGWRVAVHFNRSSLEAEDTASLCSHYTPGAFTVQADLSDAEQLQLLFEKVVVAAGQVDAVINNASLFELDTAAAFSLHQLQAHMHVNVGAPVTLASALHSHLRQRQAPPASGVVVNLLDQKLWNPNPDFLSYTLSKAALEQATTLLAQALSPEIRVVGVAPGLTLNSHLLSEKAFEALHKLSPLGKSSTVEDVVQTIVFACHNKSITGTTLLVDGGQHLSPFQHDFSLMGHSDA